jgi:small subunit ribosomal protein S20
MANIKSAIKRIGTSEKRRVRNQAVKSAARTYVKKARASISETAEEAEPRIVAAISALDRAARKGVIHPNNAARRKSRLMKAFNAAQAAATAVQASTVEETEAAKPKRRRTSKKAEAGAAAKAKPKTQAKAKAKAKAEPKARSRAKKAE